MFNWMLRKSTRKHADGEETERRPVQNLEEIKALQLCHLPGTAHQQIQMLCCCLYYEYTPQLSTVLLPIHFVVWLNPQCALYISKSTTGKK